jgi:hypothetical protein
MKISIFVVLFVFFINFTYTYSNFKIDQPCPEPIYPNFGIVPLLPRMDWTDIPGTTTYQMQISLNSTFTLIILDVHVPKSEFQIIVPLPLLTLLFWRVRSNVGNVHSPFCWVESFTTGIDN